MTAGGHGDTALRYAAAAVLVREAYAETWSVAHPGLTFYVEPAGFADETDFLVPVGAREVLVDGDLDLLPMDDAPAVFVDRETGAVHFETTVLVLDRIEAMTPAE